MINKSQITMTVNDMTNTFSVTFENIELNRQIVITFKTGKWELIQFEDSIPSAWDTPENFEYEQRHEKLEDAMMVAQTLINTQVEKSDKMQEISIELPIGLLWQDMREEDFNADATDSIYLEMLSKELMYAGFDASIKFSQVTSMKAFDAEGNAIEDLHAIRGAMDSIEPMYIDKPSAE